MSETEASSGTLHRFDRLKGEKLYYYIARYFTKEKGHIPIGCTFEDCTTDLFEGAFYNHAVISDGIIYTVSDVKNLDDEDIYEASIQPDGTIKFVVKFYNGSCCFSEAIDTALKRMKQV